MSAMLKYKYFGDNHIRTLLYHLTETSRLFLMNRWDTFDIMDKKIHLNLINELVDEMEAPQSNDESHNYHDMLKYFTNDELLHILRFRDVISSSLSKEYPPFNNLIETHKQMISDIINEIMFRLMEKEKDEVTINDLSLSQ